jgi:hypothetical protein
MKKDETTYIEEFVRIIRPTGSRIFKDNYKRVEAYDEDGDKIILFIEKLTPRPEKQ